MSNIRYFTNPDNIEPDALKQIQQTASMPFVVGVAVMPDVHLGKGSTVGTVVATKGAIMPSCVGVDIGCGMIAARTVYKPSAIYPMANKIREGIERRIPVGIGLSGMNSRLYPETEKRISDLEFLADRFWGDINYMNQRAKDWRMQLGTLGGGNHFIEICAGHAIAEGFYSPSEGTVGEVWITLHSGSRAVGNKTGNHWTSVARKQAKKYHYASWLPHPEFAYLTEHSDAYWEYLKELKWCQAYALLNREEMLERVLHELYYTVNPTFALEPEINPAAMEIERINCHHNFSQMEYHNNDNVMVTRKGAISARIGERGLIPGSMGTPSYIVTGLGHDGSYQSAPHGAGRAMSRTKARKLFTVEDTQKVMDVNHIECRIREAIVDEHPGAYKSIQTVMQEARELVRPTTILSQIINVKGD